MVSVLRLVTHDGHVFCNFIMGKARLASLKTVSIPRLELMAATLAVQAVSYTSLTHGVKSHATFSAAEAFQKNTEQ